MNNKKIDDNVMLISYVKLLWLKEVYLIEKTKLKLGCKVFLVISN
jgi:hypothetical protein